MKSLFTRYLKINTLILLVLGVAFAILDATLRLGKFHGLVFALYLFYAAVAQGVVNLVLALIRYLRDERTAALAFLLSGLVIALLGALLAYLGGQTVAWLRG
jgi:hypothetical protein